MNHRIVIQGTQTNISLSHGFVMRQINSIRTKIETFSSFISTEEKRKNKQKKEKSIRRESGIWLSSWGVVKWKIWRWLFSRQVQVVEVESATLKSQICRHQRQYFEWFFLFPMKIQFYWIELTKHLCLQFPLKNGIGSSIKVWLTRLLVCLLACSNTRYPFQCFFRQRDEWKEIEFISTGCWWDYVHTSWWMMIILMSKLFAINWYMSK